MPSVYGTTDSDRETSAQKQKGPEEQKFSEVALRLMDGLVPSGDRTSAFQGGWCGPDTTLRVHGKGSCLSPMAQQRQMKGVSQEAGGVWLALDSEEAACFMPAGASQEPPYQAQGHARVSPTWPV